MRLKLLLCTQKNNKRHSFIYSIFLFLLLLFLVEYKFAYEMGKYKRFSEYDGALKGVEFICI